MSSGSVLEPLQLQLLERWSSLLLHTFAHDGRARDDRASAVGVHRVLRGAGEASRPREGLRAESDQPAHAVHT
jgi:hypothetical protein